MVSLSVTSMRKWTDSPPASVISFAVSSAAATPRPAPPPPPMMAQGPPARSGKARLDLRECPTRLRDLAGALDLDGRLEDVTIDELGRQLDGAIGQFFCCGVVAKVEQRFGTREHGVIVAWIELRGQAVVSHGIPEPALPALNVRRVLIRFGAARQCALHVGELFQRALIVTFPPVVVQPQRELRIRQVRLEPQRAVDHLLRVNETRRGRIVTELVHPGVRAAEGREGGRELRIQPDRRLEVRDRDSDGTRFPVEVEEIGPPLVRLERLSILGWSLLEPGPLVGVQRHIELRRHRVGDSVQIVEVRRVEVFDLRLRFVHGIDYLDGDRRLHPVAHARFPLDLPLHERADPELPPVCLAVLGVLLYFIAVVRATTRRRGTPDSLEMTSVVKPSANVESPMGPVFVKGSTISFFCAGGPNARFLNATALLPGAARLPRPTANQQATSAETTQAALASRQLPGRASGRSSARAR